VAAVPSGLSLTPLRIMKQIIIMLKKFPDFYEYWYNRQVVATVPSGLSLTTLRIMKQIIIMLKKFPDFYEYCRMIELTIDRVWIGNQIY
jgi:hypothetical protein